MSELPDMVPLANEDNVLWRIRRSASWLCSDANTLCQAIDCLDELPEYETEAEAALNNAVTALQFALTAAEEKRTKLLSKRASRKVIKRVYGLLEVIHG